MGAEVCVCGHEEDDHLEDEEVDLDGRPLGYGHYIYCARCTNEDRRGSVHPFRATTEAGAAGEGRDD